MNINNINLKKIQQLGLVLLGAYVVSGCPSPTASQLLAQSDSPSQNAAIATKPTQPLVSDKEENAIALDPVVGSEAALPTEVAFEVCAAVEDWQRPSADMQVKRLGSDSRYSENLASGSLKATANQFWDHQVISFTTYGLSARVDPETLSGVWTVIESLASCYEPEATMAINQGDRAETWLLNQRIHDLQWESDRYIMTVEPASTGLQVVQFDRLDEADGLPLEVVTSSGHSVAVTSGDWQ
ncbi:MAG: hypothetical protein HLUCCA11_10255 [Phormidesmis priestleyi Ana]|uniref:Uncharacterized protein n=1 Tax=Phormidesmis priestleyi Ana TaxID=1666911 RepID=A0A0P7YWZ8_9CYAN|nr:MAG: hypothetical protein HLUCCA11_10255 [Phormidesmis priestleyi Ana]